MGPEAGTPTPNSRRTAISRSGSTTIASMRERGDGVLERREQRPICDLAIYDVMIYSARSADRRSRIVVSPLLPELVARLESRDRRYPAAPSRRASSSPARRPAARHSAPSALVTVTPRFISVGDRRLILLRHVGLQAFLDAGGRLEQLRTIGGRDAVPRLLRDDARADDRREADVEHVRRLPIPLKQLRGERRASGALRSCRWSGRS